MATVAVYCEAVQAKSPVVQFVEALTNSAHAEMRSPRQTGMVGSCTVQEANDKLSQLVKNGYPQDCLQAYRVISNFVSLNFRNQDFAAVRQAYETLIFANHGAAIRYWHSLVNVISMYLCTYTDMLAPETMPVFSATIRLKPYFRKRAKPLRHVLQPLLAPPTVRPHWKHGVEITAAAWTFSIILYTTHDTIPWTTLCGRPAELELPDFVTLIVALSPQRWQPSTSR